MNEHQQVTGNLIWEEFSKRLRSLELIRYDPFSININESSIDFSISDSGYAFPHLKYRYLIQIFSGASVVRFHQNYIVKIPLSVFDLSFEIRDKHQNMTVLNFKAVDHIDHYSFRVLDGSDIEYPYYSDPIETMTLYIEAGPTHPEVNKEFWIYFNLKNNAVVENLEQRSLDASGEVSVRNV